MGIVFLVLVVYLCIIGLVVFLYRRNSVIEGAYKFQGIAVRQGIAVITLPMFKTLKLTPETVKEWAPIDKDKRHIHIAVTFFDQKKSVLSMSGRTFAAFCAAFNLSAQSDTKRYRKLSSVMPTRPAPYCSLNSHYWETLDLPEGDFTVIDVETTGLDPCRDEILEIGAIRYRGWKEESRYQSYICPLGRLNPEAQEKNHITWEDVSSAPLLSEEFPNFLEFIGDDLLLGYYVGYDIKFLQTRSGKAIDNITFDVWRFAKYSITSYNYKLDTLRARYGLSGLPHTALGDCESTVQALFRLLNEPSAKKEISMRQKLKNPVRERYAD